MTILLLTHSYPDRENSWRGSFIKDQAAALSINNMVIVVYFKIDYEHFAPFSKCAFLKTTSGNLTEYTLTIRRSFPVINQINYLLKTFKFIKHEIVQYNKPDLIHSHLLYPAGFLGTIVQKRIKIPNLITEHSRVTNYFRSLLHKRCVIYALKNATSVIAVSNSLRDEISSFYTRRVNVIHNIVDTDKFKLKIQKPGQILNIGFLGGLGNDNKGLDLLLKSASVLENKNFILHIGGKGILLDSYVKMARESGIESKCKFYGEIPRDKIIDFYSGLDLFVLPSRYETFGIVLIEAMACGIPVIATRCGGPEETVIPATGILIEKENAEDLAGALKGMSENLGSYDKETIRNWVIENFGKEVFIERQSSLYQEILTNNTNE
ncbi:MAG TPA: glycosyltransferase [Bacteroidales bacterium]